MHDNAILGATSPIQGSRARLEASPAVGSLSFATALADVREYLMPFRPITLAGRILHYGRYGRDFVAELAMVHLRPPRQRLDLAVPAPARILAAPAV